jgi:ferredoxin
VPFLRDSRTRGNAYRNRDFEVGQRRSTDQEERMKVKITIHDKACRGCQMCLDICPTKVFVFDEKSSRAVIQEAEDCIACLSCAYLCPSKAITHSDYHVVRNFYRDLNFMDRMQKFL